MGADARRGRPLFRTGPGEEERSAVGCRRPGPVARRTARRRLPRKSKVDRPANWRNAPRARRRVDRQAFRAGAVQRHGATLGLSIDARLTSPGLRPFAKEAARSARSLPRRGRAGSSRRTTNSHRGAADTGAPRVGEDPHSRRLSSRSGALHREGFCHSRFRRRAGPTLERAQTQALRAARCRRDDAVVPVRGLQRALATVDADGRCAFPGTLGRSLVPAGERDFSRELSGYGRRARVFFRKRKAI